MIRGIYEAHLPVSDLTVSIPFYEKLGMKLAFQNESLAFLWIIEGESWLGLWESDRVEVPYHSSIRHVAFRIDPESLETVKKWLNERDIEVRTAFKMTPAEQPLVLPNFPHAHAAIYFDDPDGNSLELITFLETDPTAAFQMMSFANWSEEKRMQGSQHTE